MNSKRPFNSGLFIIIHLANSQPLVAETLRLAKLDQIFILADNDEEALEKVTSE
jgi:anti-anti-sigma regulatory factor